MCRMLRILVLDYPGKHITFDQFHCIQPHWSIRNDFEINNLSCLQ